jgi:acrylyl-CoA reductase (NADPH)
MEPQAAHPAEQAGPTGQTGTPSTFAAYVVERNGDQVDRHVRTLSLDDLPTGDVLLRVDWSAVNYKDGMVTQPGNRVARIDPLIPGVDLVGTVLASTHCPIGTSVIVHGHDLGVAHHGAFAEFARVPEDWLVPLPERLSPRHAAAIGTAGFTAALSLRRLEVQGLVPGDGPILVTGASGGVGSMAVALLASRGYEVVASTGKSGEHRYLIGLGANQVIGRDDLIADTKRTLGPERWAGAIDCVGGSTLQSVLRTLRYGASVAASGLTGGSELETSVYPFIVRGTGLLGIDTVRTPNAERRSVWGQLASAFPERVIDNMIEAEVTLGSLDGALEDILTGGVRGRILVRPTP